MLILVFSETFIPGMLSHNIPAAGPELKAPPFSTGVSENFKGTMFSGATDYGVQCNWFSWGQSSSIASACCTSWTAGCGVTHINNPQGVSSDCFLLWYRSMHWTRLEIQGFSKIRVFACKWSWSEFVYTKPLPPHWNRRHPEVLWIKGQGPPKCHDFNKGKKRIAIRVWEKAIQ